MLLTGRWDKKVGPTSDIHMRMERRKETKEQDRHFLPSFPLTQQCVEQEDNVRRPREKKKEQKYAPTKSEGKG